ncbi:unnamed protein product [Cuscuta campestris]|uniref:Uncharacterized protein n=1 Tax=Cuscuta campestris TaxID=132261 RepID=A0A484MNM2_9ASTE|nr:unnamed protein product [Cuscuta campestris]
MRRRRKQLLKGGTGGLSFAQVMAPKQLLSSPFPLQVPALPDRAISTHRGIPCVRFSANEVDTLSSVDRFLIVAAHSSLLLGSDAVFFQSCLNLLHTLVSNAATLPPWFFNSSEAVLD